jgi:two-component system response regulator PilR (NtrC family)
LLRVTQEGRFRRLGATSETHTNARILAATNRNLEVEVRAGRFREDLFYRLNVVTIKLPPLRDRRADIPELAERILRKFAEDCGRPGLKLTDEAVASLQAREYPGNIRELENLIVRAAALCDGDALGPADLDGSQAGGGDGRRTVVPSTGEEYQRQKAEASKEAADRVTRAFLENILAKAAGSVSRAAEMAGVNRSWLQVLVGRCGIDPRRFR